MGLVVSTNFLSYAVHKVSIGRACVSPAGMPDYLYRRNDCLLQVPAKPKATELTRFCADTYLPFLLPYTGTGTSVSLISTC